MAKRRNLALSGLTALAINAAVAAPTLGQAPFDECPADDAPAQIEVLPFSGEGNTCGFRDTLNSYNSTTCTIPGVRYSGPDAIYKVWLHEGNEVAFHLGVHAPADLVLVLIQPCGNDKCVTNSTDFIGSRDEDISAAHYEPGIYYLVVDSAQDAPCGSYTLTVTGVNPTPDLVLSLASSPEPVVAGESLAYTLTVTNVGALDATGVEITQALPKGVKLESAGPDCTASGGIITCRIGKLAVNASERRQINVLVNPETRGTLMSTANAKANEGEPTPQNNTQEKNTTVIAKSDLSIQKLADKSVVAGTPLTYALRLHNAGPSDATQVTVTDSLPRAATFRSASSVCKSRKGTVVCSIPRIAAGANAPLSITVDIDSSASQALSNTAQVSAVEPDPGPGQNSDTLVTRVIRRADLSITKTGPTQVSSGDKLTYVITVSNHGPSDSSGATVTDTLPLGVTFAPSPSDPAGCTNAGRIVTCRTGEILDGDETSVRLVVDVDPSLRPPTTLSNTAGVAPLASDERDLNGANDRANWDTSVKVDADLSVVLMAQPVSNLDLSQPVIAGENLLYTVTVTNNGPSDSSGGTIRDQLATQLTFVASPDGCKEETNHLVTCPVPSLPAGNQVMARFVAAVSSGATGPITNMASVESADDPMGNNNLSNTTSTEVERKADLVVALSDAPDAVIIAGDLTYTLAVTNNGPSDAAGVTVSLTLPRGGSFVSASDLACRNGPNGEDFVVTCGPDTLPAGATKTRQVHIKAPGARGIASANASVSATTDDPDPSNNTATETTTLAAPEDSDLVVTKTAGVEVVVAGDVLHYTIAVANHGPVAAAGVTVKDPLPSGVTFVPELSVGCTEDGGMITCDFGTLMNGDERSLLLAVRVLPEAPPTLQNQASVPDAVHDPNKDNNVSSLVETAVVTAPPLVLPFFAVDSAPAGVTALFAVKNPSASPLGVRYDYFLAGGGTVSESSCLPGKGTHSRNLRDLPSLRGQSGHVGITPIDLSDDCPLKGSPPPLSGDFIRTDPGHGASGLPLVSTDTARLPPELCRRWSVRFLNDKATNSSTELIFFVPGNKQNEKPVAKGKVYNEKGQIVQEISISDTEEAFRKTTRDEFDQGVDLLASFGSVEWEFREGVIGNVAAVYKAAGKYAVAVPGFCRDRAAASSVSPLIVPYFEVDPADPAGVTTLFAVRNETEKSLNVGYQYFSAEDAMLASAAFTLSGHETRTVNLRDVPELRGGGRITGFVQIARSGQALSGDFVLIDPHQSLALGGALIDADPGRSSPQLCQYWDVRFLQGEPLGAATDFVFYLSDLSGKTAATGQVYKESGVPGQSIVVPIPLSAFRVTASQLDLTGSGSVEWNLGDGVVGNVSAIFTSNGGSSVLVPGVCRDAAPQASGLNTRSR